MSPAPASSNLVRAAGGLAAVRLGVRLLGVAVGLVVSRLLGPEGLGCLTIPNLVLVTAPFLTLGLPDALVRELPLAGRESGLDRRLVQTSWHLTGLISLLLVCVAWLSRGALGAWFADTWLLCLSLASGLCNVAYKVSYSEFIGRQRFADLARLQLLQGALRAALVLALLFALPAGAQVYALHAGVSLSLLGSLVWAARRGGVTWPRYDRRAAGLLWRSGPPMALAALFLTLLVVGDRLVMSRVLPLPALGIYEQGVLIRDGLLLLPAVLLTVLIPDYAARQGDPAQRAAVLADVSRQMGLVAVGTPVLLGLALLQLPWLFALLLPRFLPGLPLFQLTVAAMGPVFLSYIPVSLLMSEGRAGRVGLLAAACLGAMVAADLAGPPAALEGWLAGVLPGPVMAGLPRALWGVLAALACFWTYTLAILALSRRRHGFPWRRIAGWLAPTLALGLAVTAALGAGALRRWDPWTNGAALVAALLLLAGYQRRTGQLTKVWRARHAPS